MPARISLSTRFMLPWFSSMATWFQRRGGTVILKAVTEAIHKVQIGTDKTAAELAIVRLNKELEELKADYFRMQESHSASSGRAGCGIALVVLRSEERRIGKESRCR